MDLGIQDSIRCLRRRGVSYAEIAHALGIPETTVKTFCMRNGLRDADLEAYLEAWRKSAPPIVCKQCGEPLLQGVKRKPKQFCSDACRLKWWNAHRREVNKKGVRKRVCLACGKRFVSYDAARKYCCQACYLRIRFGRAGKAR